MLYWNSDCLYPFSPCSYLRKHQIRSVIITQEYTSQNSWHRELSDQVIGIPIYSSRSIQANTATTAMIAGQPSQRSPTIPSVRRHFENVLSCRISKQSRRKWSGHWLLFFPCHFRVDQTSQYFLIEYPPLHPCIKKHSSTIRDTPTSHPPLAPITFSKSHQYCSHSLSSPNSTRIWRSAAEYSVSETDHDLKSYTY